MTVSLACVCVATQSLQLSRHIISLSLQREHVKLGASKTQAEVAVGQSKGWAATQQGTAVQNLVSSGLKQQESQVVCLLL